MAITPGIYAALDPVTGNRGFVYAVGVSGGASDSGKLPMLDVNGKLDPSFVYGGGGGGLTSGDVLLLIDSQKTVVSSGSGSAGKLATLDFNGKLHPSVLPTTSQDEILALIIALG